MILFAKIADILPKKMLQSQSADSAASNVASVLVSVQNFTLPSYAQEFQSKFGVSIRSLQLHWPQHSWWPRMLNEGDTTCQFFIHCLTNLPRCLSSNDEYNSHVLTTISSGGSVLNQRLLTHRNRLAVEPLQYLGIAEFALYPQHPLELLYYFRHQSVLSQVLLHHYWQVCSSWLLS